MHHRTGKEDMRFTVQEKTTGKRKLARFIKRSRCIAQLVVRLPAICAPVGVQPEQKEAKRTAADAAAAGAHEYAAKQSECTVRVEGAPHTTHTREKNRKRKFREFYLIYPI